MADRLTVTVGREPNNHHLMTTTLSIDITRLEKIRIRGDKIEARCPACAADGGDRRGNHLFANRTSRVWGCAARPGDAEHRSQIWALVGIRGEQSPESPDVRDVRRRARAETEARQILENAAKASRRAIATLWAWDEADVWEDSPQRIDCPMVEHDSRWFLQSLFPQEATVWTGEVFHSGTRHADHFRTVKEWQDAKIIGPMVSPATWKPVTCSRTAANVLTSPFTVLDFDGFDGKQPDTPEELRVHIAASLAIVRWLRERRAWKLAAILFTGSKSIHAWFHTPPPETLASLRHTAGALGIDPGLIGRPEHPSRLPGHRHGKTNKLSRVLWLQLPIAQ